MIENILSLGNKVEMQQINMSISQNPDDNKRVYVSQILEFDDDEEEVLYLAMPIYEGKLIPVDIGSKFNFFFYAKKGMYTCSGEAINRYKSDKIYVLVVRILSELKKFQRRQFFRLEKNMEFHYKFFTEEDEKYFRLMGKISEEMEERPYDIGMSLDISGGGMRFVSKQKFAPAVKMLIKLRLDFDNESKFIEPVAKIISSVIAKGRNDLYENRVEFVKIKDTERESLIKYIFKEERNVRKKQLD